MKQRVSLHRFRRLGAVVAAAIVCFGCFGKSQSPRFYTLSPAVGDPAVALREDADSGPVVGIGPIKIADYLDRSKIIVRAGDNRLEQAQFEQWAGSFEDNLTLVLADNIGFLLSTEQIHLYPWRRSLPIDYQVVLDIIRFDGRLDGEVQLVARWRVLGGEKKELVAVKRSSVSEAVIRPGYDGLVAAQSRALAALSREIARTIHAAGKDLTPINK